MCGRQQAYPHEKPPDRPNDISVSIPDIDTFVPRIAMPMTGRPPPRHVVATVASVLRDLDLPQSCTFAISYAQDEERNDYGTLIFETQNDESFGFGIAACGDPVSLSIEVADGLQANIPMAEGTWGEAYPRCPGHPHPSKPVNLNGVAWWACPTTGATLGRLGSFA